MTWCEYARILMTSSRLSWTSLLQLFNWYSQIRRYRHLNMHLCYLSCPHPPPLTLLIRLTLTEIMLLIVNNTVTVTISVTVIVLVTIFPLGTPPNKPWCNHGPDLFRAESYITAGILSFIVVKILSGFNEHTSYDEFKAASLKPTSPTLTDTYQQTCFTY